MSSDAQVRSLAPGRFILLDVAFTAMLALYSLVGFAVLSPVGDSSTTKGLIFRVYFYGYTLTGLVIVIIRSTYGLRIKTFSTSSINCAIFFVSAAITMQISVDPPETFNHLVRLFVFFAAVISYVQLRGQYLFVRSALIVVLFVNVASTIFALALPDIGVHQASDLVSSAHIGNWRGITQHKNTLGQFACVGSLSLILFRNVLFQSALARYSLIACCVANLVFAQSASNFVAFFGCIVFYITCMRGEFSRRRFVGGLLFFFAQTYAATSLADDLLLLLGKDASFSGRSQIWSYCMGLFSDRPLFGYGFSAGAAYAREEMQVRLFAQAVDAHSFYIQTLLDCGAVGLALVLFSISRSIWRGLYQLRYQPKPIVDANGTMVIWMVWGLLLGITEIAPFTVDSDAVVPTLGSLAAIGGLRIGRNRRARSRFEPSEIPRRGVSGSVALAMNE